MSTVLKAGGEIVLDPYKVNTPDTSLNSPGWGEDGLAAELK
jgi:hypothetical protein